MTGFGIRGESKLDPYRYLILGPPAFMSRALADEARRRGVGFESPVWDAFDITDPARVRTLIAAFRERGSVVRSAAGCARAQEPMDVVINAATEAGLGHSESDKSTNLKTLETGSKVVAEAAAEVGMKLVHLSTSSVFGGDKREPYDESDEAHPQSLRGTTELACEKIALDVDPAFLVVRTSWLYGWPGGGFPCRVLELAAQKRTVKVPDEGIGSPTFARDLAVGLLDLVEAGATGLFHLAGSGWCSRYELAVRALDYAAIAVPVEPTDAGDVRADRSEPLNLALDCTKAAALGVELPDWKAGLSRFVREWRSSRIEREN